MDLHLRLLIVWLLRVGVRASFVVFLVNNLYLCNNIDIHSGEFWLLLSCRYD